MTETGMPIGSQTYPHRQRIADGDFAGLCKDMAALGVRDLELCCPNREAFDQLRDAKKVRQILDDHGLTSTSCHFTHDSLRNHYDEMAEWAKTIGMTQMALNTLGDEERMKATGANGGKNTKDAVKRAADEYNQMAERSAKDGFEQVLHDEEFEFAKVDGDDRLTYDVLLEDYLSPLVKLQFQMFALRYVGDPVKYFEKYPGRFTSMHCQGVDLTRPQVGLGTAIMGQDSVDWPKVFAVAKANGLKNYYVEQPWEPTVQNVAYIKTLKV